MVKSWTLNLEKKLEDPRRVFWLWSKNFMFKVAFVTTFHIVASRFLYLVENEFLFFNNLNLKKSSFSVNQRRAMHRAVSELNSEQIRSSERHKKRRGLNSNRRNSGRRTRSRSAARTGPVGPIGPPVSKVRNIQGLILILIIEIGNLLKLLDVFNFLKIRFFSKIKGPLQFFLIKALHKKK